LIIEIVSPRGVIGTKLLTESWIAVAVGSVNLPAKFASSASPILPEACA
jgi:hypothetical protein